MANHASALKAHRQSNRRRNRNRNNRSTLRTALKKFSEKLNSGKSEETAAGLRGLYSQVDRAVRKGALSANAAARHKSRLTRHCNATSVPAAEK